ncbi:MAG: peptidoglycan editing factor PgeF [Hydrogenovibrio sp.]|uniref:peptidoglycan editing factor PgeF n=1 Tax=Hydrogenovibrio sp. TaxID=2065821 RepID=UPI00287088CF|nr:peptidoglycan editing factor PgeF [Hydrogenovibrio sp.]MDR9497809.1 peptidoglycan editing factor PgeF [Hydrogenovibrio sp.]
MTAPDSDRQRERQPAIKAMTPDWTLPAGVQACFTTRENGDSVGPWAAGNLADHVGDDPQAVLRNRQALQSKLGAEVTPAWLSQTHSTHCQTLQFPLPAEPPRADASWTREKGLACAVLTADCAPILLTDEAGTMVAAIHAGWRGLANGIVAETLKTLPVPAGALRAWVGPAICPAHFEVGPEVLAQFKARFAQADAFFQPNRSGQESHYLANLPGLVKIALLHEGVRDVTLSGLCTYADAERFYSYRRDGQTGRQASLIWLT